MAPWKRSHRVALLILITGFVCYLVHLFKDQGKGRLDSLEVNPRSLNSDIIIQRLDHLDGNIYNLYDLKEPLEKHIKNYNAKHPGLLKIIRHQKKQGLTQARISGWEASTSYTVAILDAHIEVNMEWAEPILSPTKEDCTFTVSPVFDNVCSDDFEFIRYSVAADRFGWALWCLYEALQDEWYALNDAIAPVQVACFVKRRRDHTEFCGYTNLG